MLLWSSWSAGRPPRGASCNARGRSPTPTSTHRLRARAEDRIRCLKDTGARNLPLHSFDANQIWLQIVALANDLLAWTQHLALSDTEPPRLPWRLSTHGG
jgi:hypothetical protein